MRFAPPSVRSLFCTLLADIMLQGFWKSPDTARRYIGLLERIVGDVVCGFLDLDHALLQHVPPVPCLLPHHFLKTNY